MILLQEWYASPITTMLPNQVQWMLRDVFKASPWDEDIALASKFCDDLSFELFPIHTRDISNAPHILIFRARNTKQTSSNKTSIFMNKYSY